MRNLVVSEVFGPTIQGEGPSCGRVAMFVRLGLCNLDCGAGPGARWSCDTPYTWDWTGKLGEAFERGEQLRHISAAMVAEAIAAEPRARLLVITGGEPLIQHQAVTILAAAMVDHGWNVEIETNGTLPPRDLERLPVHFNVSPKLDGSGVDVERAVVPDSIVALEATGRARWKFVVADVDELVFVDELRTLYGLRDVWVMPATTVAGAPVADMRTLVEASIAAGFNITPRLHQMVWGTERGR